MATQLVIKRTEHGKVFEETIQIRTVQQVVRVGIKIGGDYYPQRYFVIGSFSTTEGAMECVMGIDGEVSSIREVE